MSVNIASLKQGFTLHVEGRSGAVFYKRDEHILEIYWEMSGVPEYDILLSTEEIRYWKYPHKEEVADMERDQIVGALESWLRKENLRSDAFPPAKPKVII